MKIREVKLNKFKRFTDLTIKDVPESVKLVILVGPNGCGKTSVFEAFNHWYKYKGYGRYNYENQDYFVKCGDKGGLGTEFWVDKRVEVIAYDEALSEQSDIKGKFYFRTAHRNEPDFTTQHLSKQDDPRNITRFDTLMTNDITVSSNYQRLVSNTLSGVFDTANNGKTVEELREKLIGKIKKSLSNVFDDLQFSNIGEPLVNGSFYFTKGRSENFPYNNLSAGDKSAFDIILDLVIKTDSFDNTVYCIDEPEAHMHTALQAKLLAEMYNLINDKSQLWLATHSIGMLQEAEEIEKQHPGTVVFLDFGSRDFDTEQIIRPAKIGKAVMDKFYELAFGDFSKLLLPKTIVFCEGDPNGKARKDYDKIILTSIFSDAHPDTFFISGGSCSEIENIETRLGEIMSKLLSNTRIIKIIDQDDRSTQEIIDLNQKGIRTFSKRHLESFLLDDSIIKKLCDASNQSEKYDDCIIKKQKALENVVSQGKPCDDIKSARGEIYLGLKQTLGLMHCGNSADTFIRDTMAPLVTEDTEIYRLLESDIWGND